MCPVKFVFVFLALTALANAYPGERSENQVGNNQGVFGGNQGGRGGKGGFYGNQGEQGGQGGFGGHQGDQGGVSGNGGFGGNGGLQELPPPFLQNVTEEGRQAFFAIVSNSSLTISEIEIEAAAWATTYGVSVSVFSP